MTSRSTKALQACAAATSVFCAAGIAAAQSTDAQNAGDNTGSSLEEIVVTVQRRAEDINKVPISIAAYDQKTLDLQGVKDINDVVQFTPGIQYSDAGPVNRLSIRGISTSVGQTTTATYIDDVPVDTRIGIIAVIGSSEVKVFDLERVEVDRGPQGTLFGAGAEAGAIRFISNQPSLDKFSGYARSEVSYTQGGDLGYEAGVAEGGPIVSDKLGFRVSVWYRHDPGYINDESLVPGGYSASDANWANNYIVRAALKVAPTDALTVTGSMAYQRAEQNVFSEYTPVASSGDQLAYTGLLRQPLLDYYYIPSVNAVLDLGSVSLTATSSYLNRYNSDTQDTTASIFGLLFKIPATTLSEAVSTPNVTLQKEYIEELRLQSTDPNARLKWTLGTFYSHADQVNTAEFPAPGLPAETLQFFGAPIQALFGSGLLNGSALDYNTDLTDQQIAGYGQADFRIIPTLTLTGGVRVARLSSSFTQYANGPLNGGESNSQGSEHQTAVTPKFGISYDLSDDSLLYATESKGVRIGGANPPLVGTPSCQAALQQLGLNGEPLTYAGDSLWSTELGSKNEFFDRRVQLDADVYHIKWQNVQQNVHINQCASGFVANLGDATSDGVEFSAVAKVTNHLQLSTAIAYNDAHLTSNVGSGHAILGQEGDRLGPTPPWTITAVMQYDFELQGHASYLRVDDEHNTKNNGPYTQQRPGTVPYDPYFVLPPETNLLNGRLGINLSGFDVSLFATNILNDHPLQVTLFSTTLENLSGFTLKPRTVGITAIKRW
jgi:outer membrane receptor protein involved in Fe transport